MLKGGPIFSYPPTVVGPFVRGMSTLSKHIWPHHLGLVSKL